MSVSDPYDQDPYADDFSEPVAKPDMVGPVPSAPAPSAPDAPSTTPIDASTAPSPRPVFVSDALTATTVQCSTCGYNLTGVTIGGVCPECGMDVAQSILTTATQSVNGLAIASMVVGIVAVFPACIPFVGVVCPLVGLPMGIVALNQFKRGGYTKGSWGMGIAGVITNAIALLIQLGMLFMIFT